MKVKNYMTAVALSALVATFLVACGDSDNNSATTNQDADKIIESVEAMPKSDLTQELRNSLAYMGNEERLAYDIYNTLYDEHLKSSGVEIKQFTNIANRSEIKHIETVQAVVKKYNLGVDNLDVNKTVIEDNNLSANSMKSGVYDIEAIQTLYNTLYDLGVQSTENALKVGCMVEVTDIDDLDKYLELSKASNADDVTEAFNFLRDGSYKHYWAFDEGLKNLGVSEGCYVEGDKLLTNKDGVYPKTESGKENGKKRQGM